MTVKELIGKLRKMPPCAQVVWQDHDHSEREFNDYVGQVVDATDELSPDSKTRIVALRG
ncbi:hypothetical protein RJQ11_01990 [Klebsiella pneumoniae]|uniref:hypothetical protein n=1 Tax=Klebsiella pneumoniae TaxID=573 RepID=UPI000B295686|nr:hypothetical protein [Klebsiella pneumoniae]MDC7854621.1 hypothetical protein [Klebsiella pneumoniae]MDW5538568.1 hypothetical protein [Klebsiella pneumoniae]QPW34739.1 hypothetical protein IT767_02880 [Klebsiella pneumoniae subsp. pneumoniae ATCC 43816]WCS45562.1 hypothetical protein PG902_08980 [Klebsiella pneumoniae]